MPDYPHLILRDLGRGSRDYRPNGGGSGPPNPRAIVNRPAHARRLGAQLDTISRAIADVAERQRELGLASREVGLPVTIKGVENEILRVGGRLNSRSLPLLGVSRGGSRGDRANIFITGKGLETLKRALGKYASWRGGRRTQRFNLFETTSQFRVSDVADLWQDDADKLPEDESEVVEWEVWLRPQARDAFDQSIEELEIEKVGLEDAFIDAIVLNVIADRDQMSRLVLESAGIIELRPASSFSADYLELDPEERLALTSSVTSRLIAPAPDAPSTVMIDTGSNHRHPMIGIALDEDNCHAIDDDWPVDDHAGHGSQMSGLALYGDVEAVVTGSSPLELTTRLESVTVTAPIGSQAIPARDAIDRAVRIVEAEGRDAPRVYCLAATAPGEEADGRPNGTSMMVDKLAWNDGRRTRMFCVAGGNVAAGSDLSYPTGPYDERNKDFPIQSPGQAINALTVGAATSMCDGFDALAPEGDLCPSARTSQGWEVRYANKPDIVMEGGNHEVGRGGLFSSRSPQTMLLSTGRNHPRQPFGFTGETSAATAQAAGLMTRLRAAYPSLRAETLRGLAINSARWTPAMIARHSHLQRLGLSRADAWGIVLDCYGWGVPDEERLFRSAGDALTLVVEDGLRPYIERTAPSGGRRICLREMKSFRLPWPAEALRRLNQTQVEMRCTLSYFVEPDPGGAARGRPDRYSSHRLRFAVKAPNDTHLEALQRINQLASEDDLEEPELATAVPGLSERDAGWTVGRRGNLGSVHQDVWRGSAAELAQRDGISVFPVRGWWAEGRDQAVWDRRVRFSLIVSIDTPPTSVDLMAEAMAVAQARNMVAAAVDARPRRRR